MNNKFRKIISILLTAIIILTSNVTIFAETETTSVQETVPANPDLSGDYAKTIIRTALAIVKNNYKYDISDEELYRNALYQIIEENPEVWESAFRGIFDKLDEHSAYFSKEAYESFTTDISGEICGIGVSVLEFSDGLLITKVYTGSPAEEAGLKSGDKITTVDGFDIKGQDINIARSYITGQEGTQVRIGYVRDDVYFETVATRRPVAVDSGRHYSIPDSKIGYIQLYSFDEQSNSYITSALNDFENKGITDIIFDLRNNPGGSLYALEEICQHFIPEGPIIHIEYKNPLKNYTIKSNNKAPKYNLIVLINENSASAAEAFAGAIQDTGVGIVIGSQSYGKGTMQNLTKFKVGGGIKLTEAEYLTPNKRNINGIGIEPDFKCTDSMISYSNSDMKPISYDIVLKEGDRGEGVTAIKQRLDILGYSVDLSTDIFDEQLVFATKKFQENVELYPYGVMDITTQLALENIFIGQIVSDNAVFNKAVEIFKTNTLNEYKHTWSPDDYKIRQKTNN